MDENYLDNLLNEVSLDKEIDGKIEDELDSQMANEKRQRQESNAMSKEDMFNLDLEKDADFSALENDLIFSEEQMDELDKLDNLADLDIGDLDFADIDLNDLDMTKLDSIETNNLDNLDDLLKDFEGDLEIADSFDDTQQGDAEPALNENLNEDTFDTDQFLDSLLEETEEKEASTQDVVDLNEQQAESFDYQSEAEENAGMITEDEAEQDVLQDGEDLDSLLDMLGEEMAEPQEMQEGDDSASYSEAALDEIPLQDEASADALNSQSDSKEDGKSKKRSFMQILFGDPDEDDILSEEELAAIDAKKAAKKAKKEAAKAAKQEKAEAAKAEKALKDGQKKKEAEEAKQIRAQKKAERKAEEQANAEPEKPLNKPMVVFIFSIFLGGIALFYLALNNFDYTQAIQKAADYFAKQKYHRAYDEIKGVEVKEKDEELKDRIYTVMYVERLYESYQYNIQLGFQEKALDSLLRGVSKYYEHYDEAVELDVASDLEYSFNQIQTILETQYGITLEQAIEINALPNYEYAQVLAEYVRLNPVVDIGTDTADENSDSAVNDGEDTAADDTGVATTDNDEDTVTDNEEDTVLSE